jgi:hypothetical protein
MGQGSPFLLTKCKIRCILMCNVLYKYHEQYCRQRLNRTQCTHHLFVRSRDVQYRKSSAEKILTLKPIYAVQSLAVRTKQRHIFLAVADNLIRIAALVVG